jgi:CHAT domain-containing protein/Tfp pilus assembly protein PilF
MIARARITTILIALIVAVGPALVSADSQPDEISAIEVQFNKLYASGQYDLALAAAQKLEALVETERGTENATYAVALNYEGIIYSLRGKYVEAESLYLRSLAIREKTLGPNDLAVAESLNNLGILYKGQGKDEEAEHLFQHALSIKENVFGVSDPEVANAESNLAAVYRVEGKYDEAEQILRRALTIKEGSLGPSDPRLAETLNNLANVYLDQGKLGEAERFYQRALTIQESSLGPSHPAVATTLINLAQLYQAEGEDREASGLYTRAFGIEVRTFGPNHPELSQPLNFLAGFYQRLGQNAEAEQLYQRALAVVEQALGVENPRVIASLIGLATLYESEGRYAEAEALDSRVLEIEERTLGANHPSVARALNNMALIYVKKHKYDDAQELYKRALTIEVKVLGADDLDVAQIQNNLALLYSLIGKDGQALAFSRMASAILIADAATKSFGGQQIDGIIAQRAVYFRNHLSILAANARQGIEWAVPLGREGFGIAQWALQSSTGAAVREMAARFATGNDALGALVRQQQDLAAFWSARNEALVDALSKSDDQRNQMLIDNIRKQMAATESKLTGIAARLEKGFHDFAATVAPRPLKVEEVQKLLETNEALVFFLTSDTESYVFAVTRDGFYWKVIPLGADALAQKVAAFRRGLDINKINNAIQEGRSPDLFDLSLANELYATLLGPVEPLIKDKKQLLLVPSGALTALPFGLLVTKKPAVPKPDKMSGYRDAAWLIKRQAITVLPSVASLKALRVFARKDEARKPMVGFGDPVFDPGAAPVNRQRVAANMGAARDLTTDSYTDFWQGAEIDRAKLAQDLKPLPGTSIELQAVAKDLGAPFSDIHLGRDASVTTVKRLPLADYRVVYFATHALVAGDVKGLGEPALALSIPAQPTDSDDGLLTASEVAQLKLDADWVVLSACNTAAGDKPGAEALSGLARAFFYAGARALLVSQWAVATDAATRLTTSTFDILEANPTIGRAEALRRAELAYLNDTSDPRDAYPAFWGPFEIVGEGAVH